MNNAIIATLIQESIRVIPNLVNRHRSGNPAKQDNEQALLVETEAPEEALERIYSPAKQDEYSHSPAPQSEREVVEQPIVESVETEKTEIEIGCVPCSLGHWSTSAGLLNEAVRFKGKGITSNEVLDRIAKSLAEQNALERVDLSPEKLRTVPEWSRGIAEEALEKSRQLRHRLEGIKTIEQLGDIAADTETYYKKLNRDWYRAYLANEKPDIDKIKERVVELAVQKVEEEYNKDCSTS